jgi:hypothetical protein
VADVSDFPATFPPESHGHLVADVSDFPATFPPESHGHLVADVSDFPATFPPESHGHLVADVSDFPATFPPATHTHDIVAGLGVHTGRNNLANQIVRTDTSGHLNTGYINLGIPVDNTGAVNIFTDTGDAFTRRTTIENVAAWGKFGRMSSFNYVGNATAGRVLTFIPAFTPKYFTCVRGDGVLITWETLFGTNVSYIISGSVGVATSAIASVGAGQVVIGPNLMCNGNSLTYYITVWGF